MPSLFFIIYKIVNLLICSIANLLIYIAVNPVI